MKIERAVKRYPGRKSETHEATNAKVNHCGLTIHRGPEEGVEEKPFTTDTTAVPNASVDLRVKSVEESAVYQVHRPDFPSEDVNICLEIR